MLYLAIVDKLNRAGFVVAPYNTPEEVPSVKSVSGPARHVGEADKRVRDSRGGSPCGENRCGIGECREGEGTLSLSQERSKLTRTIFFILRSEVSSIEKYDAPRRMVFFDLGLGLSLSLQFSCFSLFSLSSFLWSLAHCAGPAEGPRARERAKLIEVSPGDSISKTAETPSLMELLLG